MGIISGVLSFLITLGIPIGIGVLIYRSVRRGHVGVSNESVGMIVRRVFHYGMILIVLILVAIGLSDLLALTLPEAVTIAQNTDQVIARSLAFIIVGVPVLIGLALWATRSHRDDPTEATSFAWSAYLSIATITALVVTSVAALSIAEWALGVESFDPESMSRLLVWGAVFGAHWRLNAVAVPAERMRFHRVVGSAIGLGGLAVGVWAMLAAVLRDLYGSLFTVSIADRFSVTWRQSVAGVVVGGLVWWWYWLAHASRDHESSWIRQTYLLLLGVLSGLVLLVSSGARLLYEVAVWFVGSVAVEGSEHFIGVPGTLAAAVVGAWLWWYHRSVLAPSRAEVRNEIDRVYDYVVSAVGLVSAATGLAILLTALLQTLAPAALIDTGGAGNTLILAVVMLVVGTPLWWAFWSRLDTLAVAQLPETTSITRRLYLFLLFGVGGLTALISLLVMLGIVIEAILSGSAGPGLWFDVRIPVALVLTVGAVAGYHWVVYRGDRARTPAALESPIRDLILLGASLSDARLLAESTGAKVQVWERLDTARPPLLLKEIQGALVGHQEEQLLVLAGPTGVEVVPFRESR